MEKILLAILSASLLFIFTSKTMEINRLNKTVKSQNQKIVKQEREIFEKKIQLKKAQNKRRTYEIHTVDDNGSILF